MRLWRRILANNRLGGGLVVLLAAAILGSEHRSDQLADATPAGAATAAVGEVRDLTIARLRDGRAVVRLDYRFSVGSRECLGSATATVAEEELPDVSGFGPGRAVTVLYDPSDPSRLGWVVGFPPRVPWSQRPNVLVAAALLFVGVLFATMPRAPLLKLKPGE